MARTRIDDSFMVDCKDALEKLDDRAGLTRELVLVSTDYFVSQFKKIEETVSAMQEYAKINKDVLPYIDIGLVMSGSLKVLGDSICSLNYVCGGKTSCVDGLARLAEIMKNRGEGGK